MDVFGAPAWMPLQIGANSLTAVATDDSGGTTTSAAVPITIDDGPVCSVASPTNNQVLTGSITFMANTSETVGAVSSVSYYLDGSQTPIGTATTAPYNFTWSSPTYGATRS